MERATLSGLYVAARGRGEIRLDVDGRYPQQAVSGTIDAIQWIAHLEPTDDNHWSGEISYTDGATASFPYTSLVVRATGSGSVEVDFEGPGNGKRNVAYERASPHFRTVNFEFDFQAGEVADTAVDTGAHPNHPESLPGETLSIADIYERAGCRVTTNVGTPVPAPPGTTWSDMELHDAMQIHWSRFANEAQWAVWILYASLHESGPNLGGVMFDDIGPNQRQGTALFVDSFVAEPPAGDPSPAAWVDRMRFWTAVHELGHAFNLAHSWQKSLGTPWLPLANEPEARSFMNYPYSVEGGQAAFFRDFEYRFSDQELFFVRHAPERFVEMGNAAWFDEHGFEQEPAAAEPTLRLELRVNRAQPRYEFLEPVWLELKLTNLGGEPRTLEADVLDADSLTVVLRKDGRAARRLVPFRQKCVAPPAAPLLPGESLYGTVLASAGLNGWDVAEPGTYVIQAAAHVRGEDVISAPFTLEIAPPRSREEESAAGDLFTQDAARVLLFNGTRFLERGNGVLEDVVDRFSGRRIALHARVALGSPLTLDYKRVVPTDGGRGVDLRVTPARPHEAARVLEPALVERAATAAETMGHIRYRTVAERLAVRLADQGADAAAARTLDSAIGALTRRPVKREVIDELRATREAVRRR
ncbi:MAG TPA: hypothetical protein VKB07_08110 [Gaiellaceae bacterium]|nr:hypothetical protein [Gaiellaceae bacterium]